MPSGIEERSIIAMKGPPFTRKTEFATLIAKSLRCPVFSLHDFLDFLTPSLPPAPHPQDLAFNIICQMAESHLSLGVFDTVVIDSPLSSRAHLDQLIKLADSLPKTRLILVECKPKNIYLWQIKFENYLNWNPDGANKWYKAKSWGAIEEAIQNDYDESSDDYKVSKLQLDPLSIYYCNQFLDALPLPKQLFVPPPFMEAVKYMIKRKEGDDPDVVVYCQWQQLRKPDNCCKTGHCITNYAKEGLDYDADCSACEKKVNGAAYTCADCSLALHKECAESFDKQLYNKWGSPCPKLTFLGQYRFPDTSVCVSCKEKGGSFSDNCASCLFETHIRCRLMPTVVWHDCDEHFMSIDLSTVDALHGVYKCAACGGLGRSDGYSCKICNLAYHYKCLTQMPRRVKHEHGGHHHHMLLKLSTAEVEEDYLCHECLDKRDPHLWFYSCEECSYESHLNCILRILFFGSVDYVL